MSFEGSTENEGSEDKQEGQPFFKVDDRSFDSPEDLEKHVTHASTHISTLESENAELRKKLEEAKGIDSILQKLEDKPNSTTEERKTEETSQLSIDDVVQQAVAKVLETNQAMSVQEQKQQQLSNAMKKAQELFGSEYKSKVQQIAKTNGISSIDEFCSNYPEAFDRIFFAGSNNTGAPSSNSTVNPSAFQGKQDDFKVSSLNKVRKDKDFNNLLTQAYAKYGL
jgi:hypothetical protein